MLSAVVSNESDLPKLESIQTGVSTFTNAHSLQLRGVNTSVLSVIDMPCLQSLKIGSGFYTTRTVAFESCFPAVA